MGLFNKNEGGMLGALATLGGLAILSSMFDVEKERVVHEYVDKRAEREEEIRQKEHARKLEIEKRKREAENPNAMEFINDRLNEKSNSLWFVIGYCFLILFAMASGVWIIFVLIALVVAYFHNRNLEKEKEMKKCIDLIIVHGERNIMVIANEMNCGYDETVNRITKIISKGFIKGFFIDNSFIETNEGVFCKYCGSKQ